ncbi:MAG: hypothetical protein WCR02_11875 [Sphaerochaetaceae bacterium]
MKRICHPTKKAAPCQAYFSQRGKSGMAKTTIGIYDAEADNPKRKTLGKLAEDKLCDRKECKGLEK